MHVLAIGNPLGGVPQDLKDYKKLLSLTDQTLLHKPTFYPVTAYFMSAGLNLLHLSRMQLKQAGCALTHVGQVLFNKRAMASLLKTIQTNCSMAGINNLRGCPLNVVCFSGDLQLCLSEFNGRNKASKVGLSYGITEIVHDALIKTHMNSRLKNQFNLVGALVVTQNHQFFIDSTEIKQSLMLHSVAANPRLTMKRLINFPKRCGRKTTLTLTLRLFTIAYAALERS